MKKKTEDLLKQLFDYQKFENDPKLNQAIKDSDLVNDSFVNDKDLVAVSGGKLNADGTFTFKKGERYYKDHMQYWFYEVLEDYINVSADTRINVDQYSTISDTNQGHTTVSAYDLQYCANYNGVVR